MTTTKKKKPDALREVLEKFVCDCCNLNRSFVAKMAKKEFLRQARVALKGVLGDKDALKTTRETLQAKVERVHELHDQVRKLENQKASLGKRALKLENDVADLGMKNQSAAEDETLRLVSSSFCHDLLSLLRVMREPTPNECGLHGSPEILAPIIKKEIAITVATLRAVQERLVRGG